MYIIYSAPPPFLVVVAINHGPRASIQRGLVGRDPPVFSREGSAYLMTPFILRAYKQKIFDRSLKIKS